MAFLFDDQDRAACLMWTSGKDNQLSKTVWRPEATSSSNQLQSLYHYETPSACDIKRIEQT